MKSKFQEALDSGYSEQEILNFLKKDRPEEFNKYQEAIKEGYTQAEIFEYLGERKKPSAAKEVAKEALAAPTTGFLGAYGNIQELASRLMGVEQPPLTEAQELIAKVEATGPESLLPFLSDEDIAPALGRLPRTQELREALGLKDPETYLGGAVKRAGETAGGLAALPGGVSQGALVGAGLGGFAGQAVERAGGSPLTQFLAEIGAFSLPGVAKAFPRLAAKPVPSKTGVTIPQAALKEKPSRFLKPAITEARKERLLKNVSTESEKLIDEVRKKEFPISKKIEQGIDVAGENEAALKQVEKIAAQLPEEIESKHVSDYLTEVKQKISETPVPSAEKMAILKRIEDDFLPKYESSFNGTRFYSPKQYLKQFRDINNDLKSIYETNLVYGKRPATISFYEGFKEAIEKTFEQGAPKEFSTLFKETNKIYSQTKYLDKFNQIFEKLETGGAIDSKKLSKYIANPKQARELRRLVGKESFDQLVSIERDLDRASKALNSIETTNVIKELSGLLKSGLISSLLKLIGITIALPIKASSSIIKQARGYLLTQPQAKRDVQLFLSAIKSGNKKAIQNAIIRLDSNLQKYEQESEL